LYLSLRSFDDPSKISELNSKYSINKICRGRNYKNQASNIIQSLKIVSIKNEGEIEVELVYLHLKSFFNV